MDNIQADDFWARIKALSKTRRITQDKICGDLGFNIGSYRNRINRSIFPDAEETLRLARYFGVSVEYLLTGTQTDLGAVALNAAESNKKLADENLLLISENRRLKENIDRAVNILTSQD